MIKRILAWCVIMAVVGVFLWLIGCALSTPNGRIALAVIAATVAGGCVLIWALGEVMGL